MMSSETREAELTMIPFSAPAQRFPVKMNQESFLSDDETMMT